MKLNNKQNGFNLIELMITITLGSFLIIGAAYAFQEAKKTYVTNDNVARVYETAQYVLDVLEEDIRLTNYWGLHNKRAAVTGDSNDPAISASISSISNDCDEEWSLDLRFGITGSNELTPNWANNTGCLTDFKSNTDTMIVRHADLDQVLTADLVAGQAYIRSSESPLASIFAGTTEPNVSVTARNYQYLAHGYYVTNNSYTSTDAVPMLRRMALSSNGTNPIVESQEIAAGVEDFQIQFGVDYDQKSQPGYGVIDRYVNPDSAVLALPTTRVMAVRIWLLIRGESPEFGFNNDITYNYGNVTSYQPNDNFRRLVVSKTVQIRNMTDQ